MTDIPLSYWLGIGLTLWWVIDLFRGEAYIWHPYKRSEEPGMYWLTMLIWGVVAASCFIYPHWSY